MFLTPLLCLQIKSDVDIFECHVPLLPANTNVILTPRYLGDVSSIIELYTIILYIIIMVL